MSAIKNTGAEQVRFNLSFLYSGVDDPQLETDLVTWIDEAKVFHEVHEGNLSTTLGQAIRDQIRSAELSSKIGVYLFLLRSVDTNDQAAQTKIADVEKRMSLASADYLTFFDHELVELDDAVIATLAEKDETVKKHLPSIAHARVFKKHLLKPEVEASLMKRSPFGPSTWSDFFDEVESDLELPWKDGKKSLSEMLHLLSESKDAVERAEVLKTVHEVIGGHFYKYSARTLNTVVGAKEVEDRERGYAHPMESRNKGSKIPDAVVEALHEAVRDVAGPLARRYYSLKAKLLGLDKMAWSDRNAPLPFSDDSVIPWDEAITTVIDAYQSFSPTLAGLIRTIVENKWIDAPYIKGKSGGAFNYSVTMPGGKPVSFTFLNYMGSRRDVMTVAHELGHGVHGLLAAEAQGTLMMHAPMAYCETASVFGEMTTFNFIKAKVAATGDDKAVLSLLCGKIDDMMNTAVRQIGFSAFERKVHGAKRRLAPEEFDALWMETVHELYGAPGDVFTYEHTERLWTYVSHFHRPFYVYAYAFGELFTQSLYASRERLGDRFEPLYLEMLRSGDTLDASELLAPFGLDPTSPSFWADGIRVSIGAMVEEAEKLAEKI